MNITEFKQIVPESDFEKIERKTVYDIYVKKYNKKTDKVQYLSVLMTLADGFEKQIKNIESHLERDYRGIFQPLDTIPKRYAKGDLRLSEHGEKEFEKLKYHKYSHSEFIEEFIKDLKIDIDHYFEDIKNGYSNSSLITDNYEEHLNVSLSALYQFFEGFKLPGYFQEVFKDAIYWSVLHFKTGFHIHVLDQIIQKIIEKNFGELKTYSELSDKEKENIEGKQGRPLDISAPQSMIEKKVEELIKQGSAISKHDNKEKRFVKDNNQPKPTTISNYIVSNFPELTGELDPRTVFNRVKSAIDNMK